MASKTMWILAVSLVAGVLAAADTITLNGKTYRDVLVYESASIYYVKIPHEGRVVSAPKDKVDADSVEINDNPYYREELKLQYDEAKADLEAGRPVTNAPRDPAFDVPEESGSDFDRSALYGGVGSGGSSLGISQQQAQSQFAGVGVQFNGKTGQSQDGIWNVRLEGPEDNLTGIVVTLSAPQQQMAQVMGASVKLTQMISQAAPWFGQWASQNQAALMQGQTIQKTQDGVAIQIQPTMDGQNLSIVFTMRGA